MSINIAIDGPSASGKSTVAKELCKRLNYIHLDTGAMYRCVAKYALDNGIDLNDQTSVESVLNKVNIKLTSDGKVFLNSKEVTNDIRTDEISQGASIVSTYKNVREYLVALQQKMAENKGFIMDGRDIGTVVLPNAELKIFMTASAHERAKRRYLENQKRGIDSNLEELEKEIAERDYRDTHREISPLKKAEDAIEIDTSDINKMEVVERIMKLITDKI
jgi:CMP/dCMP kinase